MKYVARHQSVAVIALFAGSLAFASACSSGSGVGGSGGGGAGVGGAGVGPITSAANGTATTSTTGKTTGAGVTTNTTGASTAAATTSTGMSNDPSQLCVDTINNYRATRGLPPMTRWTPNETCVDGEAKTDGMMMSAHYAFMHGASCGANAQNECPGYSSDPTNMNDGITTCLQLMWDEKNQPGCAGCDTCDFPYQNCTNCDFDGTTVCGHYLNMKSSVLSTVACGFWSGGWYAQDYK